jgi:hypothetical protein
MCTACGGRRKLSRMSAGPAIEEIGTTVSQYHKRVVTIVVFQRHKGGETNHSLTHLSPSYIY